MPETTEHEGRLGGPRAPLLWGALLAIVFPLASCVFALVLQASAGAHVVDIDWSEARADSGLAFRVQVDAASSAWLDFGGDSMAGLGARTELHELGADGAHAALLGPGHSTHAEIRERGGGRYSYWGGQLLFSKREAEVERPALRLRIDARVAPSIVSALAILLFVGIALGFELLGRAYAGQRRRRRVLVIAFAALGFAIAVFWLLNLRARAPETLALGYDSNSFLAWYSLRSAGYPAFLSAFTGVTASLRGLFELQLCVLAACCSFAAGGVAAATRSPGLGAAFLLICAGSSRLFAPCLSLMSEPLFSSCLVASIGCVGFALASERRRVFAALGAIAAAAFLVRPIAAVLAPAIVLVLLARREARWRGGLAAGLGAAFVLAIGSFAHWRASGTASQTTLGSINLAGVLAPVAAAHGAEAWPEVRDVLREIPALTARGDERPQFASSWERWEAIHKASSENFNRVLWGAWMPRAVDGIETEYETICPIPGALRDPRVVARVGEKCSALTREALSKAPLACAELVFSHLIGGLRYMQQNAKTPQMLRQMQANSFDEVYGVPAAEHALLEAWWRPLREQLQPAGKSMELVDRVLTTLSPAGIWRVLAWIVAALATVWVFVALVRRRAMSHTLVLLGVVGLTITGYCVGVSVTSVINFRYVASIDVLFILAAVLATGLVLQGTIARIGRRADAVHSANGDSP